MTVVATTVRTCMSTMVARQ